MSEEDRTFQPSQAQVNRAREQGLGVGQREMDMQRDPNREQHATDPERTEPFAPDDAAGAPNARGEGGRNAAGLGDGDAQLGSGTPANVDIHDTGDGDNPEADWGEAIDPEAEFSSTNTRRGVRTEAERGQGAKTRQLNKDIISRRT